MSRLLLLYSLVIGASVARTQTFSPGALGLGQPIALRTDPAGNLLVAGTTSSPDFPATNSPAHPASPTSSKVFVTKLDSSGKVVFSLVIGGSASELARGLALDRSGNAFVTGWTLSADFPATAGALQPRLNLAPALDRGYYGMDAFVMKISGSGTLVYSTYLGGTRRDFGEAIAVDADGNAYVTGRTGSYDFPVTPGAFQRTSTHYGLTDDGAFVAKLDSTGSKLAWATYLAGSNYTFPHAIAVGPDLSPVIAGETTATDFPVRNALQPLPGGATNYPTFGGDAFVSKLQADGSDLVFSTFLGGISFDSARAVAVDATNSIYVAGTTGSARFPADTPQYLAGTVLTRLSRSGEVAPAPAGLTVSAVLAVTAAPSDQRVLYAGAPEGLFRSTDGGDTWSATALDRISVGAIVVDPRNPDVVYAGSRAAGGSGNHGGLWKSTDGGLTFQRLPVGPDGIWPANYLATDSWISFLLMDPRDPDTLYLVLGYGGISSGFDLPFYKTTDGGASWSTVGAGIRTTLVGLAFDPESSSTLYAVTPGFYCCGLFGHVSPGTFRKSVDSGATWTTLSEDGDFTDLTVANGFFYSGKRVSADRGMTWTTIPIPGRLVAFDAERLYALTPQGQLYDSADQGASWNPAAAPPNLAYTSVTPTPDGLALGSAVWNDAFLTRLDPTGGMIFARFLGGAGYDGATSLVIESDGRALLAGVTTSSDFPTVGSQATFAGGVDPRNGFGYAPVNLFVAEFDLSGSVTFSTAAGQGLSSAGVTADADAAGGIWTAATSPDNTVSITRVDRPAGAR